MMKIGKEGLTAACPRCNYKIEDTTHILECRSEGAKLTWDASIGNLKYWLNCSSLFPAFSEVLLLIVGNFKKKDKIKSNEYYSFEGVEKVLKKKRHWVEIIYGRVFDT